MTLPSSSWVRNFSRFSCCSLYFCLNQSERCVVYFSLASVFQAATATPSSSAASSDPFDPRVLDARMVSARISPLSFCTGAYDYLMAM